MNRLTVNPITDATVDLFGKDCDDLQENVAVGTNGITGTLKYVTDYTGFDGSNPELQSGNYIALICDAGEDATITVTVTNPVVLDPDGMVVLRIADKDRQTITVVAEKDGWTQTKEYSLTGLTCQGA